MGGSFCCDWESPSATLILEKHLYGLSFGMDCLLWYGPLVLVLGLAEPDWLRTVALVLRLVAFGELMALRARFKKNIPMDCLALVWTACFGTLIGVAEMLIFWQ